MSGLHTLHPAHHGSLLVDTTLLQVLSGLGSQLPPGLVNDIIYTILVLVETSPLLRP